MRRRKNLLRHRMRSNGGNTYKSREKGAHCRRLMACLGRRTLATCTRTTTTIAIVTLHRFYPFLLAGAVPSLREHPEEQWDFKNSRGPGELSTPRSSFFYTVSLPLLFLFLFLSPFLSLSLFLLILDLASLLFSRSLCERQRDGNLDAVNSLSPRRFVRNQPGETTIPYSRVVKLGAQSSRIFNGGFKFAGRESSIDGVEN